MKNHKLLYKWLKNHIYKKKKHYLIFIVLILLLYIFFIWKFIYNNILQIEYINVDIENKIIEKRNIVSTIVRIKSDEILLQKELEELKLLEEEKSKNLEKNKFNDWFWNKNILNVNFNPNIDPIADSSILKFVTSDKSFNDKKYIPSNLVWISSDNVYDTKNWTQLLRKEAKDALQKMASDFNKEFWESIVVVSAYRSYEYQKWIKDRWCPDNLCAKAGYSEHQTWLAVDLWEASTNYEWLNNEKLQKYYRWLNDNAYKYWFHNTYQKWLKIDWYEIEPWHWRYLWVDLATKLKQENITIAEYYKR